MEFQNIAEILVVITACFIIAVALIVPYHFLFRNLKRKEKEILESRERLRLALACGQMGTWDWEMKSNGVVWNDHLYAMLGLDPHTVDATADTFFELIHPEDLPKVKKQVAEVLEENKDFEYEFRIVRGNGETRWLASKGRSLRDDSGKPVRMIGVNYDITRRKHAEKEIEDLAKFPSENTNPVLRVDEEGILMYANKASDSLLQQWSIASGDRVPSPWKERILKCYRSQYHIYREIEVGERTISFSVVPIQDSGYVNLYGNDITELKRVTEREKRLAAAVAAFQTAVESVHAMEEAVFLLDMDGNIRAVSKVLEELVGYRESELVDMEITDFMPELLMEDFLQTATEWDIQKRTSPPITVVTKGNNRISVIPTLAFLRKKQQIPSAIFLKITDISEIEQAERQERLSNNLLRLFAVKSSKKEYIESASQVLQKWSGCRYCDIDILNEEGNSRYRSLVRFPLLETSENQHRNDGYACKYEMAEERESLPCLTPGKSFHCGDISGCIDVSGQGKKTFCGVTLQSEFATVAIIPIRHQSKILGTIILADESPGKLAQETFSFIESISLLIGEGLHRFCLEESLRESELRFRNLVEHSPAITYMAEFDATSTIKYVSSQIERILGFSPTDFKGDPDLWRKQLHPADRYRILEELKTARKDAKSFVLEYRMLTRNGQTIWIHDHGAVISDSQGVPIYVQGVMYDATEQKNAHETLRELSLQLTLAEESERKRLAVALHDSVSQTLTLCKIKIDSIRQLITQEKIKSEIEEVRTIIAEAVEQTRALTFELSPPVLYELGLGAALDWLGERFENQYHVRLHFTGKNIPKTIDESVKVLIFQSVRELLTNAGKHADANRVALTVVCRNDKIHVVVKDNGKGFDRKLVRKASSDRHTVGFFSIHERMRHIGGNFQIESEPGKGTTATLSSPLSPT